jgi:hypothetical protein
VADSYILGIPSGAAGATQIQLASYTRADPGPNFANDFEKQVFVEGPNTEGYLSHEETTLRRMSFPLTLIASRSIPNLGLYDQEALLKRLSRPGAYLDLKPQGATTAVRFDVVAGQWEPQYDIRHNREGISLGTLKLVTKPYGYWPTWITLASHGALSGRDALANGMSLATPIIGDVPGEGRIAINASVVAGYPPDFIAWSLAARPSFTTVIKVASTTWGGLATYMPTTNIYGFDGASGMQMNTWWNSGVWTLGGWHVIPAAMEPAYRGRFRVYAHARSSPAPEDLGLLVDTSNAIHAAMASSQPVANPINNYAPAGQIIDLGEITLPPTASGAAQAPLIRIWVRHGGAASQYIHWGGMFLLPLDGPHGVLPHGLQIHDPIYQSLWCGGLELDAANRRAGVRELSDNLNGYTPLGNAYRTYRGGLPYVGASTNKLILLPGLNYQASLLTPSYAPGFDLNQQITAATIQYRPRFRFVKGL